MNKLIFVVIICLLSFTFEWKVSSHKVNEYKQKNHCVKSCVNLVETDYQEIYNTTGKREKRNSNTCNTLRLRTKRNIYNWVFRSRNEFGNTDFETLHRAAENYQRRNISETNNPITHYYYETKQVNGRRIEVPYLVMAVIRNHYVNQGRTNFGSQHDFYTGAMHANGYDTSNNPNRCNTPKDERGHIVASQLGGPIRGYNLVPQTPYF